MHVELVRTVPRDGLRLDGALAAPLPVGEGAERSEAGEGIRHDPRALNPLPKGEGTEDSPNRLSAVLLLHGVAGNFYTSSTFEPLISKLQSLGLAVLSVN